MDLGSTMVSLRRQKRLKTCSGNSSDVAPLHGFFDKGTSLQISTQEKPDDVLMPSNNVNQSEEDSPQIISILGDPAAAERVLLDLLGPADTRIMQAYADGGLKQRLAHHALASCLHLAMWLRDTGDVSKERDEAKARVAELENRVRNFGETTTKQEAVIESLRQQIQEYSRITKEYEFKLDGLLNDVSHQRQQAEMWESKWKEQEALHQEKATRLEEVLKQLGEANADLPKVNQGLHVAGERIETMTSTLSQFEVKVKQLRENFEMYKAHFDMEMEKNIKAFTSPSAELIEALQRMQIHKQNNHINLMTRGLIKILNKRMMTWSQEKFQEEGKDCEMDGEDSNASGKEVEAKNTTFWTICNHCKCRYEYLRGCESRYLVCNNCRNAFLALEIARPRRISKASSSFLQQHQNSTDHASSKVKGSAAA